MSAQSYSMVTNQTLTLLKDPQLANNWWFKLHGMDVTYLPSYLLNGSTLRYKADALSWGGEINKLPPPGGHPTITQMESGCFPCESYGKSNYFQHIWPITQLECEPNTHGFIK